ncbi:uncharacterized protein TrAtP1_005942 [Trichoderma atroviride]|uniref:uncharacterized protein n=1 Tax=Hypocrea atroviridis TaxID=63577 RepID=UPI003321BC07|nr:hypothetical protein TrAtP1_005942 [Trichoderma atroviride]
MLMRHDTDNRQSDTIMGHQVNFRLLISRRLTKTCAKLHNFGKEDTRPMTFFEHSQKEPDISQKMRLCGSAALFPSPGLTISQVPVSEMGELFAAAALVSGCPTAVGVPSLAPSLLLSLLLITINLDQLKARHTYGYFFASSDMLKDYYDECSLFEDGPVEICFWSIYHEDGSHAGEASSS